MPIPVTCACGKKYQAPDTAVGKYVRCKNCSELIPVPGQVESARSSTPVGPSTSSSNASPQKPRPPAEHASATRTPAAKPVSTKASNVPGSASQASKTPTAKPVAQTSQPATAKIVRPAASQRPSAQPTIPSLQPLESDPFGIGQISASQPDPWAGSLQTGSPFDALNPAGASNLFGYAAGPIAPGANFPVAAPKKRGIRTVVIIAISTIGGLVLLGSVIGVVFLMQLRSDSENSRMRSPTAFDPNGELASNGNQIGPGTLPMAASSIPGGDIGPGAPVGMIPKRPDFRKTLAGGVRFGGTRSVGIAPGENTQMNVYLPKGDNHSAGSLGCILVAPAGTNLLVGSSLDGDDYHDETLPYAQAGYAVIQYSLDGNLDQDNVSTIVLQRSYLAFKQAEAGRANISNVWRFIKSEMPEINLNRVYTAGHSSAGTVSLLAAIHIPGLAGCIAYAPCTDPEAFHADFKTVPGISAALPGYVEFDRKNSPIRLANTLSKPLFLFQAKDDSVVSIEETKRFAAAVKKNNPAVEFVEVPSGDHYDPMIKQGIPAAIEWLKKVDSKS